MKTNLKYGLLIFGGVVFGFLIANRFAKPVENKVNSCTTSVVKCDKEIKIDESGISIAVGKIYDATVTIRGYQNEKVVASGSGFIYKKDDKYGYILTNNHVVEKGGKLDITLSDDVIAEGKVVGVDAYTDLAVVTIDVKYVKLVAELGDSNSMKLGDTVFTVGTPVGYEYRGSITRGTLSGKNRMVNVGGQMSGEELVMNVLQIDAAINPGNSGGPLLNINGKVIGINSLKLVKNEIEGMGFAIPIEDAIRYAQILEKGEKIERPFIGISMLSTSDTYSLLRAGININSNVKAVVVVEVFKDSAAAKSNLTKGDIITKINGNDVKSIGYLKYHLYKYKTGDKVEFTYIRDGKEYKTDIILGKLQ